MNTLISFAFLHGEWTVAHKQLVDGQWKEWTGKARFWVVADGLAVIEELGGPEGKVYGAAVRTFDVKKRVWSDRWMSAKTGVLSDPVEGKWIGNEALFEADGERGLWRRVSDDEVTWEQAVLTGKTWETNWKMRFTRRKN